VIGMTSTMRAWGRLKSPPHCHYEGRNGTSVTDALACPPERLGFRWFDAGLPRTARRELRGCDVERHRRFEIDFGAPSSTTPFTSGGRGLALPGHFGFSGSVTQVFGQLKLGESKAACSRTAGDRCTSGWPPGLSSIGDSRLERLSHGVCGASQPPRSCLIAAPMPQPGGTRSWAHCRPQLQQRNLRSW